MLANNLSCLTSLPWACACRYGAHTDGLGRVMSVLIYLVGEQASMHFASPYLQAAGPLSVCTLQV